MGTNKTDIIKTPRGTYCCPLFSSGMRRKLRTTGGFELSKLRCFFLWSRQHYPTRRGMFVDIGANIGTTVIPAQSSRMVSGGLAVEPAPFVFQCLQTSLDLSKPQKRIHAVQAAMGAFDGEADLMLSPANCGDNRLADPINAGFPWHQVKVPVRKLDTIWEERGFAEAPGFIWIDAQGAETGILAGTEFRKDPRIPFFIEFFPPGLVDPEGFFDLIETHWSAFIDARTRKRHEAGFIRQLFRQMGTKNPGVHTDLFLIR